MNQPDLFLGRKLRDDGIVRVIRPNTEWFDRAMDAFRDFLTRNEYATVEAFRTHWERKEKPTHPSAWSTLGREIQKRGWVEYVRHVQSQRPQAHARLCPMYRSRIYREAA